MPMNSIRRAILSKREVTYGVDSVPAAATDGVEVFRNPRVTPLDIGYVPKEIIRAFFGSFKKVPSTKFVRIQIEMPAAGFGSLGPATPTPGYDSLLRACALSRTINAGVDVRYSPITVNPDSTAIYYYKDGRLHKGLGARGDWELQLRRNQLPRFVFDMMALDGGIIDAALALPTLTAYQEPVMCMAGKTTFSLHGFAAPLESLTIRGGNRMVYRNLMQSSEQIVFSGREASGQVEIEDNTVATKDWMGIIKAGTLGAIDASHGTVAGNVVQVIGSNVQLTQPGENEVDDFGHLTMNLDPQPGAAGNDDLTIVVK